MAAPAGGYTLRAANGNITAENGTQGHAPKACAMCSQCMFHCMVRAVCNFGVCKRAVHTLQCCTFRGVRTAISGNRGNFISKNSLCFPKLVETHRFRYRTPPDARECFHPRRCAKVAGNTTAAVSWKQRSARQGPPNILLLSRRYIEPAARGPVGKNNCACQSTFAAAFRTAASFKAASFKAAHGANTTVHRSAAASVLSSRQNR